MVKITDRYPRVATLKDLSDKLVRHYNLPNGSKFALCKGNGRFARADKEVRRKHLRKDDHPRDPQTRVAEIRDRVEAMLAPSSRSTVVAIAPDGTVLDGKTQLRNWQRRPGRPTKEERDAAENRRMWIQELSRDADSTLRTFEEAIESPHTDVTEAMIRALVDRYGAGYVRDVCRDLRL